VGRGHSHHKITPGQSPGQRWRSKYIVQSKPRGIRRISIARLSRIESPIAIHVSCVKKLTDCLVWRTFDSVTGLRHPRGRVANRTRRMQRVEVAD
jgi:hypothetical protein